MKRKADREKVISMSEKAYTYAAIGKATGLSTQTVRAIINKQQQQRIDEKSRIAGPLTVLDVKRELGTRAYNVVHRCFGTSSEYEALAKLCECNDSQISKMRNAGELTQRKLREFRERYGHLFSGNSGVKPIA